MRRPLAQAGRLVVLALLLAAAPIGCSWLIGVSGDPVTDGPGNDAGDEDGAAEGAEDGAADGAAE